MTLTKRHRVRKDPIVKSAQGKHPYRAYDSTGQEVRVDAKSDEEALELAKVWPGWVGKVQVERVRV